MHWVLGLVGAFLGALVGDIDESFLGLVLGALVGWQGARIAQLSRRVRSLEQGQAAAAPATARIASAPPPVRPTAPTPAAATSVPEPGSPLASAANADAAHAGPVPAVMSAANPPASATPHPADATAARGAPERAAAPGRAAPPPLPVAPRRVVRPPAHSDAADRMLAALKRWLFEGNVPVKLGVLILFFGVAAAIKYAVDQGWVSMPIELRLSAFAALAVAGLIWGWRSREARPAFGLSLQGGAIGVLLLIVFGAFRIWGVLPGGIAFGLIVVLVAGAALLAVLQNAMALAVLGFVGGYLAPVLISTGSGNHVALFSYYAVLNAAVFGIAWVRPWRVLNLVGFAFTFAVGTLWGAKYYRPEHFASVEPFLIAFFLFYVAIAVLYALRGPDARRPLVDGSLVFGTPLLAFPLQAALLADDRMGLAFSALAVAILYGALAAWLLRRRGVELLGQSFAALAVGFATLAVPLALSARWTSASWAVEGAALVWLGLRQQRWLPQFAGWALQGLAAAAWFLGVMDGGWDAGSGEIALLNGHALAVTLMALAGFTLSWLHERGGSHRFWVWLGFVLGSGWWFIAGIREIAEHFDHVDPSLALTAFAASTAALAGLLRGLLRWPRLGWLVNATALAGLPLALFTLLDVEGALHWPAAAYWVAWFALLLFALQRLRDPEQRGISLAHVAVLFTAAFLYGTSLHELAGEHQLDDGWRFVLGWLPLGLLLLLTERLPALGAWPLADRFDRYRLRWLMPAGLVLGIGWLASLTERGGAAPLPFVPLINPVELFQLVILLVGLLRIRGLGTEADALRPLLAAAAFGFVTSAGLRGVHHLTGAPWSVELLDDRIAQVTLTVLWTLLGVAAWIYGSRRRLWNVWLAGAILMGVVLAKLVLLDRQYLGNLAGIVSFMAVGGLLVLVGRIAPTPPRSHGRPESETEPETRA